ncbi:MAG: response regulator [Ktedonobacteraceae bacterium]|jgi:CheY-like chemotaxis protein
MSSQEEHIAGEGRAKTILVVEDDVDIGLFLISALSEDSAYHTLLVPDGIRALDVVSHVKPSLVILDYHLPNIDGLEVFDRMHTMKELEEIPSIMISANLPERELAKRSICGMKKPFELDEFLGLVDKLLAS